MNVIGLCEENNIRFIGKNHYICEKAKRSYLGEETPTQFCDGCKHALDKSESNKEEQPHETITRLCDMVAKLHTELYHAKNDIGALLFLNGNCEYCANGQVEKYCGAERWSCKLGDGIYCKPVWRGVVKESDEE